MTARRAILSLCAVVLCWTASAAEPDAEEALRALIEVTGKEYYERRDEILANKNRLDEILGLVKDDPDYQRVRWIIEAWSQQKEAFGNIVRLLDEMEEQQRGHILAAVPRFKNMPPSMEHFGREGRKLLPLAVEFIWKYEAAPEKALWRKKAAFGTIRWFGDASLAGFCLDQIPVLEADELADAAVDTALVVTEGAALKDLKARGDEDKSTKFVSAAFRLKDRQSSLWDKMSEIVRIAIYKDRAQRPFTSIAKSGDLGVLFSMEELDSWQLQWSKRIIKGIWQFGLPERTNIYGPFLYESGVGDIDFKTALRPEVRTRVVDKYKQHAKELAPILVRCLWGWTEIMDNSRKLLLIELLMEGSDHTIVQPIVDVLIREKNEPVIRALCALLLAVAPEEAEAEIKKVSEGNINYAERLEVPLRILKELRAEGK